MLGYFYVINIKLEITTESVYKATQMKVPRCRGHTIWKAGRVQEENNKMHKTL